MSTTTTTARTVAGLAATGALVALAACSGTSHPAASSTPTKPSAKVALTDQTAWRSSSACQGYAPEKSDNLILPGVADQSATITVTASPGVTVRTPRTTHVAQGEHAPFIRATAQFNTGYVHVSVQLADGHGGSVRNWPVDPCPLPKLAPVLWRSPAAIPGSGGLSHLVVHGVRHADGSVTNPGLTVLRAGLVYTADHAKSGKVKGVEMIGGVTSEEHVSLLVPAAGPPAANSHLTWSQSGTNGHLYTARWVTPVAKPTPTSTTPAPASTTPAPASTTPAPASTKSAPKIVISGYPVPFVAPANSGISNLIVHELDRASGDSVSATFTASVNGRQVTVKASPSGHEDYLTWFGTINRLRIEVPRGQDAVNTYTPWYRVRGGFLAGYPTPLAPVYYRAAGPRIDGQPTIVTLRGDSGHVGADGMLDRCTISVTKGSTWTSQCGAQHDVNGAMRTTALVSGVWKLSIPVGTGEPFYKWTSTGHNSWSADFAGQGR